MQYFRWAKLHEDGFCVVKTPNISSAELMAAIPQYNKHRTDIVCNMSPNFPDEIKLADNLYGGSATIISLKLKQALERVVTSNQVEYLPVSIINHKERVASTDYFILHPLDMCDCIDYDKSGIEWNPIKSDFIVRCAGLVLRKDDIPNDYTLFRLKHWGSVIILRGDIAEMLQQENMTGLRFPDVEGYTGIG